MLPFVIYESVSGNDVAHISKCNVRVFTYLRPMQNSNDKRKEEKNKSVLLSATYDIGKLAGKSRTSHG